MAKALSLLFRDPRLFFWKLRVKLLHYFCRLFRNSPVYVQGKMDIDARALWYNPDFARATGGYFVTGDSVSRHVLDLEPWDYVRRDMIVLLMKSLVERGVEGDLAELGVYRGNTARLIHYYMPERKLYLFDTFSGFDERNVATEKLKTGLTTRREAFSDTSVDAVLRNIRKLNDNIEVFPGFFPSSVPDFLKSHRFALVHLDADLYEPILAGLEFFYPRMVAGGLILVYDFSLWPGARKAVLEFLGNKPEIPIPMPDKSGSALIVKLDRTKPTP